MGFRMAALWAAGAPLKRDITHCSRNKAVEIKQDKPHFITWHMENYRGVKSPSTKRLDYELQISIA